MPIYEFQCGRCGARKEALMRLSDPDPVECPECHAPALKRMLSAPSFRLAGSGWYETDFKKDGKRNLVGDNSDAGAKTGGEGKTEAKPEAKAAEKSEATPAPKAEPKPAAKPDPAS